MNNPLNCSKISRDSSRVYSDKALRGEVLVSYQFRLGTKWKRKNLAEKNDNELQESRNNLQNDIVDLNKFINTCKIIKKRRGKILTEYEKLFIEELYKKHI